MKSTPFNKFIHANIGIIIPVITTVLVIIIGGIAVYLVEYEQPRASITNLGNAF
jgi:uncharacterized protein YqgC (DUF456 family)